MDPHLASGTVLYHYTSKDRAEQLRKEGLQPGTDRHSLGPDGQYNTSVKNIFLTDVSPLDLDFFTAMSVGVLSRDYVFEIPLEQIVLKGLKVVKNPVNSHILAIVTDKPFPLGDAKGYPFNRSKPVLPTPKP